MLTRQLSLKVLAPTVMVSVLLVATCGAGALYVNHLHLDMSRVFAEHVASVLAAQKLEATVREMIHVLQDDQVAEEERRRKLERRHKLARELLEQTRALANMPREGELVAQISQGLETFERDWAKREGHPDDAELARLLRQRVLDLCDDLRVYNAEQVAAADAENRHIIRRLTAGLLVAGLCVPLAGLALGYAVARHLYRSIYQLSVRIQDAAGRLSNHLEPVTLEGAEDVTDLNQQMQGVIEQIEAVVQRLQQSERAVLRAEQLAAVGQVAAGVAHELRNPLTSVKMLVQTGLEGPEPTGLPPEDLAIIEGEVRRMEACIQTFLDFARPPVAEKRHADLVPVVRRALALVEGRARRQRVTLKDDLPPGPVELLLDQEQIHQILLNLLLNALDVLPHGGTILVRVRPPGPGQQHVTVAVRDSGPGIAPHIKARLFEPFISGKETGLGLGLSICQRLVEAHGGRISGADDPNGGAVFTFTLPAGQEQNTGTQQQGPNRANPPGDR